MNKKRTVVGITIAIIITGYFLYDYSKKTSFEELITDLISEDEEVEQISVYGDVPFLGETVYAEIKDQKVINTILSDQLRLKRASLKNLPHITKTLVIKTDKETYEIGFDSQNVVIGSKRYLMTERLTNPIDMRLESEDLEWELIKYTPF
ncbi:MULTISPECIES: hypothetical protein [Bhargavaea]|uniref:Uncharacterized protein n=1 Tax=Bhargavaea changchunensis TaxID=2134037 RepID=A0ABW2NGL8_9BACL|nr:hypothetical protein [Bhargavaea sp. CC-171006]